MSIQIHQKHITLDSPNILLSIFAKILTNNISFLCIGIICSLQVVG